MDECSVQERAPEISVAFEELNCNVKVLDNVVNTLIDRIAATLRPAETGKCAGVPERSEHSSLASSLYDIAERVSVIHRKVQDALSRCEL